MRKREKKKFLFRYYYALIKLNFQLQLVYRFEWLMSLMSGFFGLFIQVAIWQALYRGKVLVEGVGIRDMITYILLAQILGSITAADFNHRIAYDIRTGNIGANLIRPVSYKIGMYSEQLGGTLKTLAFDVLPVFLVGIILFGFRPPQSGWHFAGFLVLTGGAAFLNFHFQYIQGLLCFWLLSPIYMNSLNCLIFEFFTGYRIPLWFWPKIFQTISAFLPFQLMFYVPLSIYLGKIPSERIPQYFLLQLAWCLGLLLGEKLVWRLAIKKLIVQGG